MQVHQITDENLKEGGVQTHSLEGQSPAEFDATLINTPDPTNQVLLA